MSYKPTINLLLQPIGTRQLTPTLKAGFEVWTRQGYLGPETPLYDEMCKHQPDDPADNDDDRDAHIFHLMAQSGVRFFAVARQVEHNLHAARARAA